MGSTTAVHFSFLGPAVKFSETPTVLQHSPPLLGEHTDMVLKDLIGFDDTRLKNLREDRVIQ